MKWRKVRVLNEFFGVQLAESEVFRSPRDVAVRKHFNGAYLRGAAFSIGFFDGSCRNM